MVLWSVFSLRTELDQSAPDIDVTLEQLRGASVSVATPDPGVVRTAVYSLGVPERNRFHVVSCARSVEHSPDGGLDRIEFASPRDRALFNLHTFEGELPQPAWDRIHKLNELVLAFLKSDSRAKGGLAEIAADRGLSPEFLAAREICFISAPLIREFSARHTEYSDFTYYLAGWKESFRSTHGVSFCCRQGAGMLIPYRNEAGILTHWQIRRNNEHHGRYAGFPLDRLRLHRLTASDKLYNSKVLSRVAGQRLYITEGELKTAILEDALNASVIGLPGIFSFDEATVDTILEAGPGEVVICFDRDPLCRNLRRTDGVSDPDRKAYELARMIIERGLTDVKIVSLPLITGMPKVGIDDLVLDSRYGVELVSSLLDSGRSPDDFGMNLGISEEAIEVEAPLVLEFDELGAPIWPGPIERFADRLTLPIREISEFLRLNDRSGHGLSPCLERGLDLIGEGEEALDRLFAAVVAGRLVEAFPSPEHRFELSEEVLGRYSLQIRNTRRGDLAAIVPIYKY